MNHTLEAKFDNASTHNSRAKPQVHTTSMIQRAGTCSKCLVLRASGRSKTSLMSKRKTTRTRPEANESQRRAVHPRTSYLTTELSAGTGVSYQHGTSSLVLEPVAHSKLAASCGGPISFPFSSRYYVLRSSGFRTTDGRHVGSLKLMGRRDV